MTVTAWETKLTPMNGSDQSLHKLDTEILILELLTLIVALAGLAGNTVVVWLPGFHMQRNPFSVYILNLAGAKCLLLCCEIMHSLCTLLHFYSNTTNICSIVFIVSVFAYISGLNILSTISTEHCLSVLRPIWYHCHHPRHMSAIMCAQPWAMSLLLSILEKSVSIFMMNFSHPVMIRVSDYITITWMILLFVLASGSSLTLMTRLLCGFQWVKVTRLYVTLMLIVLVFLFCGMPFDICWFLLIWLQKAYNAIFHLYLIAVPLSCVNSCANPIIYFFVGSFRQRWWRGRQTLRLVLQRALQDTSEVEEHGESLLQGTLEM